MPSSCVSLRRGAGVFGGGPFAASSSSRKTLSLPTAPTPNSVVAGLGRELPKTVFERFCTSVLVPARGFGPESMKLSCPPTLGPGSCSSRPTSVQCESAIAGMRSREPRGDLLPMGHCHNEVGLGEYPRPRNRGVSGHGSAVARSVPARHDYATNFRAKSAPGNLREGSVGWRCGVARQRPRSPARVGFGNACRHGRSEIGFGRAARKEDGSQTLGLRIWTNIVAMLVFARIEGGGPVPPTGSASSCRNRYRWHLLPSNFGPPRGHPQTTPLRLPTSPTELTGTKVASCSTAMRPWQVRNNFCAISRDSAYRVVFRPGRAGGHHIGGFIPPPAHAATQTMCRAPGFDV